MDLAVQRLGTGHVACGALAMQEAGFKPNVLVRVHLAKLEAHLGGLLPAVRPPNSTEPVPERHPPTARMVLRIERAHLALQEDWFKGPRGDELVVQFDIGWLEMLSYPADAQKSPLVRHKHG